MYHTLFYVQNSYWEIGKLNLPLCIETADNGSPNNRLIVTDRSSALNFLVDTGADISLIPRRLVRCVKSASLKLYAANGTTINTYGSKTYILNFGLRREFKWKFCIADIQRPIIDADFLSHYGLLVDIKNKRILDSVTGLTNKEKLSRIHFSICTTSSNSPFHRILTEFPELTRFSPISADKLHHVEHHIVTKVLRLPQFLEDYLQKNWNLLVTNLSPWLN